MVHIFNLEITTHVLGVCTQNFHTPRSAWSKRFGASSSHNVIWNQLYSQKQICGSSSRSGKVYFTHIYCFHGKSSCLMETMFYSWMCFRCSSSGGQEWCCLHGNVLGCPSWDLTHSFLVAEWWAVCPCEVLPVSIDKGSDLWVDSSGAGSWWQI